MVNHPSSSEDQDSIHRGQEWLEELLKLSGLSVSVQAEKVEDSMAGGHASEEEDDGHTRESCWLTIESVPLTPEQISTLTGAGGSVLDAVQYLANTILNLGRSQDQQQAYTIELNGYRAKRQAELRQMAEYAAEQVRQTGQEFEMKSLSSAERRQVHTFLKSFPDLDTYSRGREPDRRLVVKLAEAEVS